MSVSTKTILQIARTEGEEIFLLFGRTAGAYVHIAVNGETVCKTGATPYSWTPDLDLSEFKNERWYRSGMNYRSGRTEGIPNVCDTCCRWIKNRSTYRKRLWPIHWGCQVRVNKAKTSIKKTFLDVVKTMIVTSEFCSKPTLDPNVPICLDHMKMWKQVEKWLDHDTVKIVQQFSGIATQV